MAKTVLTECEKRELKIISLELLEIRRLVEKLAETLVNLSDKEILKLFNASQDDLYEKQVENYRETLKKQLDTAEEEFQP